MSCICLAKQKGFNKNIKETGQRYRFCIFVSLIFFRKKCRFSQKEEDLQLESM